MTYASGNKILASDLNGFIGNPTGAVAGNDVSTIAFANATEATDVIAGIVGVGYGDRGWGQTSSLTKVQAGDKILSAHWSNLRTAIKLALDHTGTASTNLVPATELEVGDKIIAHDGVDNPNDELTSFISTVDTNRFNTDGGASMSNTTSVHTSTRTTAWSAQIQTEVTATWTDTDNARYFFNSGGEIRINLDNPNGTSAQDNDWRSVLQDNVGEIRFGPNGTTQSASSPLGTVSTTIGYWDLTTLYQVIYDGTNIGGGAYSSNDVLIEAKYIGTTENGGNGNEVRFRITLDDQHVADGGGPDTVTAGTNADFDLWKAVVHLTGIESPTWATTTSF